MSVLSDQNSSLNSNSKRFNDLLNHFEGKLLITRKQFRELMQLSKSSDWRLFKSGSYPKFITLPNGVVRIELNSLAEWLENGGSRIAAIPVNTKKRGRPIGSRNKRSDSFVTQ